MLLQVEQMHKVTIHSKWLSFGVKKVVILSVAQLATTVTEISHVLNGTTSENSIQKMRTYDYCADCTLLIEYQMGLG